MCRQGVTQLIAFCHNDACRHQALIDVSSYPGDTLVSWFQSKIKCGKCGRRGQAGRRAAELGSAAGDADEAAIRLTRNASGDFTA
jgi:hypothetical protein